MELKSKAWARLISLKLQIPGSGSESDEISFDKGLTVIAAKDQKERELVFRRLLDMGPGVETEGNIELLRKYGRYFFIDDQPLGDFWPSECIPGGGQRFHEEILSLDNYQEMLGRKIDLKGGFAVENLPPGEQRCWRYASSFATNTVLGLNLPVVIDSPYVFLNDDLRRSVHAFFRKQDCQLILFGREDEFAGLEIPVWVISETGSRFERRNM